jgi:hypothetical protein
VVTELPGSEEKRITSYKEKKSTYSALVVRWVPQGHWKPTNFLVAASTTLRQSKYLVGRCPAATLSPSFTDTAWFPVTSATILRSLCSQYLAFSRAENGSPVRS